MFQEILLTCLRMTAAFVLLMLVIRAMGRKALSQMTSFDFAVAITLGSLTAHVALDGDKALPLTVTALITLGLVGVITDLIHIKSFRMRKYINSEPLVIIEKGQIVKANMIKSRMTLTRLTSLLREKGIFNMSDVNYAIFENDGQLSVLVKSDKSPLTPFDMKLNPPEKELSKDIILDGKIMYENLHFTNLTESQLLGKLTEMGFRSAEEVFYASLDSSGQLYVSKGIMGKEQEGEHGIE